MEGVATEGWRSAGAVRSRRGSARRAQCRRGESGCGRHDRRVSPDSENRVRSLACEMRATMENLQLTRAPMTSTGMLIRKPVTDVFEAFVNPNVTTQFWFT